MNRILTVSALAIAAFVTSQPSHAYYNGRWCAKIDNGGGSVSERCEFQSFGACRHYILGESRSFCVQNHWYQPYWTGESEAPHRVRRY